MKKSFKILIIILLANFNSYSQNIAVQVLSAVEKDKKIDNAEVLIQRNGENSTKSITNSEGKVSINSNFADDSNSIMIIKKDNYSTLVVKCPCNNFTYALSPVMKNLDGMRIVLNWGRSPEDLDSHLKFPGSHVFFSSKIGDQANLDVDDTDSYGPETITIENKKFGEVYNYFVHDYTNRESSNDTMLSKSNAKVFVYVGQSLVKTYYVPLNKIGNVWNIFNINGNGEIEDINTISSKTEQQVGINDGNNSYSEGDQEEEYTSTQDKERAKLLNQKGDVAYKSGNVDQALNFYKSAIELYPTFGQAYGSLGLMYIKKGMKAEAIWANRKAISNASGNNANIVRAGSYYNIAKIFEGDNNFQSALNYYKLAKSNNQNPVYDNAIARVKAKL
jgi:uncharacterized protein YfaP (DUF2135 family)